jgi:POT family proton-dependent oligopeptide transporter
VNLGAFFAPLVCGTLGELYGWHYGFGAAGIGMCVGLAIYLAGSRYLPARSAGIARACGARARARSRPIGLLLATALCGHRVSRGVRAVGQRDGAVDGHRRRSLRRQPRDPGDVVPVAQPLFVFVLTPLVVAFWNRDTSPRPYRPGALRRMSLGAFGVALSYLLLCGVIVMAGGSLVHWGIVVAFFLLYTLAEIYILPVGLSLFATLSPSRFTRHDDRRVVPRRIRGQLLAGYVGTWWSWMVPPTFFAAIGLIAALAGIALALLARTQAFEPPRPP